MATGDQTDVLTRLRSVLPQSWFPQPGSATIGTAQSPTPILESILAGFAEGLSWIYSLLQFALQQTRLGTSSGGWVDLAALDYFGNNLPRANGESDAAYIARIEANLFQPANTRGAIQQAVENVTGSAVRMIEPWQPNDNARYGVAFYGVDTKANPGQYSNGSARDAGLIVCELPTIAGAPTGRFGYRGIFYTPSLALVGAAGAFYTAISGNLGAQAVYNAINKFRSVGVRVYVKFSNTI